MARTLPSVVLVGRPNVGKSTLFNRIIGHRRAIVAPLAGTTRDSLAFPASWRGMSFRLQDTGGLFGHSEDPLHELVIVQGRRAIDGADLLVFLVDGREGLVSGDQTIAKEIRQTGLPVVLAVNKTDDKRGKAGVGEFHHLGFEPVNEISAEHGTGIGDLLDAIRDRLMEAGFSPEPDARSAGTPALDPVPDATRAGKGRGRRGAASAKAPSPVGGPSQSGTEAPEALAVSPDSDPPDATIAIIGRPNVGKSSLLNRLLKQERVMVSDVPGTTRDAIDADLTWHRRHFRIVDTAGMRRPGRVRSGGKVELVSVAGARKAIFDADVVALVIDAEEGPADQDAAIGGEADSAGRGVAIVVNKWDLVRVPDPDFAKTFDDELRRKMRFLDYAPILHISALTGERTSKVLETIDKIAIARRKRVPTPALNKFVRTITAANPPVSPERRHVKIMYVAQTGVAPPTFVFFTNVATTFHFSYERYLINQLREHFGFLGTPIRIQVRRRAK